MSLAYNIQSFSRILVFSLVPIRSVKVSVDEGQYQEASGVEVGGPLYVLPWQPALYASGFHMLEVMVTVSHVGLSCVITCHTNKLAASAQPGYVRYTRPLVANKTCYHYHVTVIVYHVTAG